MLWRQVLEHSHLEWHGRLYQNVSRSNPESRNHGRMIWIRYQTVNQSNPKSGNRGRMTWVTIPECESNWPKIWKSPKNDLDGLLMKVTLFYPLEVFQTQRHKEIVCVERVYSDVMCCCKTRREKEDLLRCTNLIKCYRVLLLY